MFSRCRKDESRPIFEGTPGAAQPNALGGQVLPTEVTAKNSLVQYRIDLGRWRSSAALAVIDLAFCASACPRRSRMTVVQPHSVRK
jgi:hypothetical protein